MSTLYRYTLALVAILDFFAGLDWVTTVSLGLPAKHLSVGIVLMIGSLCVMFAAVEGKK